MNKINKILFTTVLLGFQSLSFAQLLPDISNIDYGFTQKVTRVEAISYNLNKEPIKTAVYQFNKNGFIKDYHIENLKDNSWQKTKSYYKNDRLYKRVFKYSNIKKNKKHSYTYNTSGQLIKETITHKNGDINNIVYDYKNNKLHQIKSDINNSKTTYFYSNKGNLYKAIKTQKDQNEIEQNINYLYLEGKEITSYVSLNSNVLVTTYLNDFTLQFDLNENEFAINKLQKGIKRFNEEAPKDKLPFSLRSYSNQTAQFYSKNKDKLKDSKIVYFDYVTDDQKNKITYAKADVDVKTKTITNIQFYKTSLLNRTVVGETKFNDKVLEKFKDIHQSLNQL